MSVSGLCQICENAPARHSCERCGAVVCDAHFDTAAGYCLDCATEVRRARGETDAEGEHYRL
ncbi:hypothetical protein ACFQH6_15330 [Halobacteriaceae archaeon GCM10025711]